MVNQFFIDLYSHLQFNSKLKNCWLMPEFIYDNKEFILKNLLPLNIISTYQMYHDIGKPYCKTYELNDREKYHFYDHAKISAETFSSIDNTSYITAKLIERDMEIHTLKDSDLKSFIGNSQLDLMLAITLLISGFCEIHANAEMFGGLNSTSFKIKFKQINTRGKAIFKKINGEIK